MNVKDTFFGLLNWTTIELESFAFFHTGGKEAKINRANHYNPMNNFEEMGLNPALLQAIGEMGFTEPTPVQEKAIPQILTSGQDLIALAQTGTGKTAAFGLPLLNQIDTENPQVQAIILCPTRELCLQIAKDLKHYATHLPDVRTQEVYGGAEIRKQIRGLKQKPQIVVGTPGRTKDLINRGALKIDHIHWVVLDEADEMLDMGFRDDINYILAGTPEEKQTLLFSATMPRMVRKIAAEYMDHPVEIAIGKTNSASSNVEHQYYVIRASDRYRVLKRIADINPDIYGIVFCRTRQETKDVADALIRDGYNADAIHGDLSQAQRDTVMNKFRKHHLQLLVATDVAARGIDVNELTHVINYNLPDDPEVYIHRSGRTGRAGNKGISIALVSGRESRRIRELEHLIHKKFELKKVPSGKEIIEKRLYASIDKIEHAVVDEDQIQPFMEVISQKLSWMNRDELLKRLVSKEFESFLAYYKDAPDLNASAQKGKDKPSRREERRDFTRFKIDIGQNDRLKAPNLIGLINEVTDTNDIRIGKIEILRAFSLFEAASDREELILESFKKAGIHVQLDKGRPGKSKGNLSEKEHGTFGKFHDTGRNRHSAKRKDKGAKSTEKRKNRRGTRHW